MRGPLAVVSAATLAFLIYGLIADSPSVAYYVPVTFVLVGLIALIHRSAEFSTATMWALTAIAIGNLAGGVLLVGGTPLYEQSVIGSIRYDKVYHAIASGVGAWASLEAIERWSGGRRPALIFVAVMMASGAGAIVEIVEYIGTLIRESTVVGDYSNNMQDLIANTVGACLGVAIASGRLRRMNSHHT